MCHVDKLTAAERLDLDALPRRLQREFERLLENVASEREAVKPVYDRFFKVLASEAPAPINERG